jgi:predicted CXXCH cytochrome family protein
VNDAGFGFPWNDDDVDGHFIPGMDLSNYFESVDEAGSRFWDDPFGHAKSHRQQWLDMRWTAHFKEGGMTCMSCHVGHDATINGQLKMESDALCLNCHTDVTTGGEDYENHDRHYPGQVRCVDCHMRFVAKSAVEWDIHSHSFQIIYPEASEDSGIPNSCERCHDEDPEDIQDAINEMFGPLRPRAEPRVIDPADGKAKRHVSFSAPELITLDGTKSYDPNGRRKEIVTYAWSILSAPAGSDAELSSRLVADPEVQLDLPGTYVFSLVVADARQTSKPATLTLVVD